MDNKSSTIKKDVKTTTKMDWEGTDYTDKNYTITKRTDKVIYKSFKELNEAFKQKHLQ